MMHRNPLAGQRVAARAARVPRVAICAVVATLVAACSGDTPPRRIACDPGHTPCGAETAFGRVELDIAPRPIPVMTPLQLSLTSSAPLDEVRIELNGRDMDMGPNQTRLLSQGPLRWQGSATIPVCLTGRMRWEATVSLRRGQQVERLGFGFDAG